ncbi:MAG: hypothetical protein LBS63_00520 [Prevotellaceae bacterium]|jgi:hypothetical protein|nr:hypothetical protein [Prevotellaceae bacterium]
MEIAKRTKDFDCVEMKNAIQAKIYTETKGMTFEELKAYLTTRIANSPFRDRVASPLA